MRIASNYMLFLGLFLSESWKEVCAQHSLNRMETHSLFFTRFLTIDSYLGLFISTKYTIQPLISKAFAACWIAISLPAPL